MENTMRNYLTMKTGVVLATALAVGVTSFDVAPARAGSAEPTPAASAAQSSAATEFSAARKQRRPVRRGGNGGAAAAAAFAGIVGTIGAIAAQNARRDDYYYGRPHNYYGPQPGYYRQPYGQPYGYYGYRAW
jgi:hypothetical protein